MNLLTLLLAASLPATPGVTTQFETVTCTGEMLATQTRAEWLNYRPATAPLSAVSRDDWDLLDSAFVQGQFRAGKRLCFTYSSQWPCTLELSFPLDTLPTVCTQALDWAPTWLREELTHAFFKLGDSAGAFYANLLLNAPQPYTDEVAFCIAKIGPQVLTHRLFDPALLLDNAEKLYEIDDSLQYADIVEHGSQPGDYYSTVRYAVAADSDTVWTELPRNIYYYYVVHPTTSDELPRMDDYVSNMHWREYLFYEADSGYPVLADCIKQTKVVWSRTKQLLTPGRSFDSTDCALDVIGNWASRTVPSAASGNRPIHPNVIAHEHNGNCGELQDLLTAASRTCLIPTVNTSDPCEDHVWSEFWDETWYPYQVDLGFGGTHIADSGCAYDEQHGGTTRVSSIWSWRPDGFWWTVTRKYSNVCSLYVRVLDSRGVPIDGARVLMYSEGWYGGYSVSTIGFTNDEGAVAFELGELRNFYAQVQTPFDTWPSPTGSTKIINISQTGAVYYSTLCMPFAIGAPKPRYVPFTDDSMPVFRLDADVAMPYGLDCGYSIAGAAGNGDPDDSIRFYRAYADKHPNGTCDVFFTDTAGYADYLGARRFDALWIGDNVGPQQLSFTCPTYDDAYHLVFSTEDKLYSSRELNLGVRLYAELPGVAEKGAGALKLLSVPSPVRGRLRLNACARTGPLELRVYDVSGALAAARRTPASSLTLEEDLAAGVYLVRLSTPQAKLVKQVVVVR
jgi:hypothetical protein